MGILLSDDATLTRFILAVSVDGVNRVGAPITRGKTNETKLTKRFNFDAPAQDVAELRSGIELIRVDRTVLIGKH